MSGNNMGKTYGVKIKGIANKIELKNITHIEVENGIYKLYCEREIVFVASASDILYIIELK